MTGANKSGRNALILHDIYLYSTRSTSTRVESYYVVGLDLVHVLAFIRGIYYAGINIRAKVSL